VKASLCSIWGPVLLAIQGPTDIAVSRAADAEAADTRAAPPNRSLQLISTFRMRLRRNGCNVLAELRR
jgi:hypothetical protein